MTENIRASVSFSPRGMIASDLDGTLLDQYDACSYQDLEALAKAGEEEILRVIATGRSLHSFQKAVNSLSLPVDFVVFSTGAGVWDYRNQRLVQHSQMKPACIQKTVDLCMELEVDFCIQYPVPDNHIFAYHETGQENPDFARRLALYEGFRAPLELCPKALTEATQLIIILTPKQESLIEVFVQKLSELSVIRATSPLDGQSTWIEVFPPHVSKSQTTAWLAKQFAISPENVLAIGNDYNDLDLLLWAGSSRVVENAPSALKERFPVVSSCTSHGVSEAIHQWLPLP